MNIVSWIANRVRMFGNRFSGTFGNAYRVMYAGTIVKMSYTNFKRDPSPLILVLYSGIRYTHALNLNYLSIQEKQYIGRLIYALKKGQQIIDGKALYRLLKRDVYNSIVRKCYRTYFSNMIIHPKMVSAGWTPMERLVYPYNDQFVVSLNKYLNKGNLNYTQNKVAYYPQELQDRINMAINSTPVGSALMPATVGLRSATQPATTSIGVRVGE